MKLAIGTAQFGLNYGVSNVRGKVGEDGAAAILMNAASAGIDTIDTAMAYGDSEQTLGNIGIKAFRVVTKLPEIPMDVTDVERWVIKMVEDSAFRLGVASLHGLLLHRPNQLFEPIGPNILTALKLLRGSGVVKKVGISVSAPQEFEALFKIYPFDIVQCPFNLVDRRLVNSGWLKKLHASGVEIHTRSSFLQGLLLLPRDFIPGKFKAWEKLWNDWHSWLQENKTSPVDACVSYVLSFPEITRVIVGVETQFQLTEIIEASRGTLIHDNTSINLYPDISTDTEDLINPTNWDKL